MMIEKLGKRLQSHIVERTEGIPAELGRMEDDGSVSAVLVEDTVNENYARLYGRPDQLVTVINTRTDYRARLPVRVSRQANGRWVVLGIDNTPATEFLGSSAPAANVPPMDGNLNKIILPSNKFEPGRVRSLNGTDLQVHMEELPYGNTVLGNNDGDPSTEVGTIAADNKALIVISCDRTTNLLTFTKGDDTPLGLPLTREDGMAVEIPKTDLRVWAYIIPEGATALPTKPLPADAAYEFDLREWITPLMTVSEVDTNPTIQNVREIIFPNGTLTDNDDGSVTYTPTGGGSMSSFTVAGDSGTPQTISDGQTVTVEGGTGLSSVAGATRKVTLNLDDTVVTPGSYTNSSLTVDQQGRLTAASSGTAPVTNVTGTAPIASSGGTTPAISLNDTAVTPGSYTNASLTVDQKGRLTAASSGTAPVTSVTATAPITSSGGATPDIGLIQPVMALRIVFAASTANVDIASAPSTLDGASLTSGDRVLLKNQTSGSENGIWVFNGTGNALTRPTDYASGSTNLAFYGLAVLIRTGNTLGGAIYRLNITGTITIDTTSTSWGIYQINVGIGLVLGTLQADHGGTGASTYAKGDLLAGNAGATLSKVTVGTNGLPLVADSAQTGGVGWSALTIAGGGTGATSLASGIISSNGSVLSSSTAPNFTDFTNANHDHLDADDGGTLSAGAIASGTITEARLPHKYAVIEEQQAQNTAGGGSTATTWTTRVLNTEVVDADGLVTLSSNQFTPIAGTYRIHAESPFLANGSANTGVRIRIRNVTQASVVVVSTNFYLSNVLAGTTAFINGYQFTANGTDAYDLQYFITSARATNGLGLAINETSAVERYSRVTLELIG